MGWIVLAVLVVLVMIVIGMYNSLVRLRAACAQAASRHPLANAEFERILEAADSSVLGQAVQLALNAPRAECPSAREGPPASAQPDLVGRGSWEANAEMLKH